MKQRDGSGFTLVELIITMVVMTILMALGTVMVTSLQSQARDKERESDTKAIARGLEIRYKEGNPVVTSTAPADIIQVGAYPGVREMLHTTGYTSVNGDGTALNPKYTPGSVAGGYVTKNLPGTNTSSLAPPSSDGYFGLFCLYSCPSEQNSAQLEDAFNKSGTTYKDAYIYEPIDANGNACWDAGCVRFNLYWISETDKTPYLGIPGLKVIKSTHR